MSCMKTLCFWWLMLSFATSHVALANSHERSDSANRFTLEQASEEVRAIVNWITDSEDNLGMPFMIVDKREARVLMFNARGQLSGEAPALLGLGLGDDSTPGIGEKALASIPPHERTTPAGRFVSSLGHNLKGEEILWIDYENAISLHPVAAGTPMERREERLASPDPSDNRISFGCINVPKTFYTTTVSTAFKNSDGIVYVLPETRSNHAVFEFYYKVE